MMKNSLTIAALVLGIATNILKSAKGLFKYSLIFYNFKDMLSSHFKTNTILFLLRTFNNNMELAELKRVKSALFGFAVGERDLTLKKGKIPFKTRRTFNLH